MIRTSRVCAFLLLTGMYTGSLAMGMAGLQVSIEDSTTIVGETIHIQTQVTQVDVSDDVLEYDRYIDGKPLAGVHTPGLDLVRDDYTSLFSGEDMLIPKIVKVEVTDGFWKAADSAELSFVYEDAVCGDNVLQTTEECDDGNTIDGDGCSAMCLCEGICMSLLARGI